MSAPPSRARTVAVSLLFAGGLAFGAVKFGQLAFGQHDDAPELVDAQGAVTQPENKWAVVRGRVDPETLMRMSHPLGHDQIAFRLIGAPAGLVVLTNVIRHPQLADGGLWRAGPPNAPLEPATERFFAEEQTFTGTLTEPGSGMNKEGYVELDGDRFKVTGFLGSYCAKVRGCPSTIKALLVGETPRSRLGTLAATVVLGLLSLLCIAVALQRPKATA